MNHLIAQQKAFTLIELLVALAIAAAISVMAYRALDSAITANEKVVEVSAKVDEIDRVWQYMASDLLVAAPRMWRDQYGELQSAMFIPLGGRLSQSDLIVAGEDVYQLRFVRGNRSNLLNQPRSNLMMVGYRLTANEDSDLKSLWRDTWSPVDNTGEARLQQRLLIDTVKELAISVLPANASSMESGAWSDSWPTQTGAVNEATAALPLALEITLDVDGFGEVKRLFELTPSL